MGPGRGSALTAARRCPLLRPAGTAPDSAGPTALLGRRVKRTEAASRPHICHPGTGAQAALTVACPQWAPWGRGPCEQLPSRPRRPGKGLRAPGIRRARMPWSEAGRRRPPGTRTQEAGKGVASSPAPSTAVEGAAAAAAAPVCPHSVEICPCPALPRLRDF